MVERPFPETSGSVGQRFSDRLWGAILTGLGGAVLVVAGIIVWTLLDVSAPLARHEHLLAFLTGTVWDPERGVFGALTYIYGTVVSSTVALLIAAPVSIGLALFLTEMAPPALRPIVSFPLELLAGIPSVVYGLWGVFVLVPLMRDNVGPVLEKYLGWTGLFVEPNFGVGMFTASVILAIMIFPVISSISRDVMRVVPVSQREAALALGATRWEMIRLSVLRNARIGIVGSVILGLGRALGETMAVTMVIGNHPDIVKNLFAPAYTLASVIANEFTEATGDLYLSALIEIGLALFLVTIVVNAIARLLVWAVTRGNSARPA